MKFSAQTISLLQNFSEINQSIIVKTGDIIKTMSAARSIMAKAKISEKFLIDFAIYDLGRLLNIISLFTEPSIDLKDTHLIVSGKGGQSVKYMFVSPDMVKGPPDKELELEKVDIEFELSKVDKKQLMKALAILQLPEIAVVGDGKKIKVETVNVRNSTSDVYSKEVGSTKNVFNMILKAENLKLIDDDYKVQISSKGLCYFKAANYHIEYWVPVDGSSKYGNS